MDFCVKNRRDFWKVKMFSVILEGKTVVKCYKYVSIPNNLKQKQKLLQNYNYIFYRNNYEKNVA